MKLIRYGQIGNEKPGILTKEGKRVDVSTFTKDFDESFFGKNGIRNLNSWLAENIDDCKIVDDRERWAAPLARPSKIVCIGLNYASHAKEAGLDLPTEPTIFFKATSSICGPYDDLIIPKNSKKTDWEVELAFVISKTAKHVSLGDAMKHVAGYMLHNDYSEREFQLEQGGQWVKGKSCDSFAPLGPYIATRDEVTDPHKLRLWLKLNGEIMQDSNSSELVFNIPEILSYTSKYMTLLPGDIISTGTPFGVGLGLNPPRYIKEGDVIELGIDGLGISKQRAIKYSSDS